MARAYNLRHKIAEPFTRNDPRIEMVPESGCWIWMRCLSPNGYGLVGSRAAAFGTAVAHRAFFVVARGGIPAGMYLDHVCRNRACVNPDHLRPVTPRENATLNSLSFAAANSQKERCGRCDGAYSVKQTAKGQRRICLSCVRESRNRYDSAKRATDPMYVVRRRDQRRARYLAALTPERT